jgi:hypothetical protein
MKAKTRRKTSQRTQQHKSGFDPLILFPKNIRFTKKKHPDKQEGKGADYFAFATVASA